ncbi:cell surface A33 antigen [Biomphalaria pfeifferi]|uniref:Cell surface A33 antigen n=1 Tax=Biomphalaria pfeifferi TaxID=112525 RepID=A0AAD8C625_BIOPF|nr:cell surface A33 antigen [Biomphalaria pfeifferi]
MSEHFMCFKIFLAGALTTIIGITGLDVRSMLTYPTNNIKGRSAILNCVWTYNANESVSALNIMKNGTVYFSCDYPLSCTKNNPTLSDRFTITIISLGDISMNIDSLECSDESTYTCQVVLSHAAGVKQADAFLRLKIPPSIPELTIDQTEVIENSNINVSCTATLGYPNVGQIVWKTYQKGIPFTPSPDDIVTSSTYVVQPGDDRCTVRNRSNVLLRSSRNNRNISIACFVTNRDFQPIAHDFCTNSTTQLCNLTNTVSILYIVSTTVTPTTNTVTPTTKTTNRTFTSAVTKPTTGTQPNILNTLERVADTDSNTVPMIVMGVILSAIIIVQFVVILLVNRRNQGKGSCMKKSVQREPHTYDQPVAESHYDYINDSYYKSVQTSK